MAISTFASELFNTQTVWNSDSPGGFGTITAESVTQGLVGARTTGSIGFNGILPAAGVWFTSHQHVNQANGDTQNSGYVFFWIKFSNFNAFNTSPATNAFTRLVRIGVSLLDDPSSGGSGIWLVIRGDGTLGTQTNSGGDENGNVLASTPLELNTWYQVAVSYVWNGSWYVGKVYAGTSSLVAVTSGQTSLFMTSTGYAGIDTYGYRGNGQITGAISGLFYRIMADTDTPITPVGLESPPAPPFTFYIRNDAVGGAEGLANTADSAFIYAEACRFGSSSVLPTNAWKRVSDGTAIPAASYSISELRSMFLAGEIVPNGLDQWNFGTDITGALGAFGALGEVCSTTGNKFSVSGIGTLSQSGLTNPNMSYPNVWRLAVPIAGANSAIIEDGKPMRWAFYLNANATTTGTSSVTGNTYTSTTIDNISSTAGILAGFVVTGSGVPINTTVVTVNTNSIIISNATTTSVSGATISFLTAEESGTAAVSIFSIINTTPGTFFNDQANSGYIYFSTGDGANPGTHTYTYTNPSNFCLISGVYIHDLHVEGVCGASTLYSSATSKWIAGYPDSTYNIAFSNPGADFNVANNISTNYAGYHDIGFLENASNQRLLIANTVLGVANAISNDFGYPYWVSSIYGCVPLVFYWGSPYTIGSEISLYNISQPLTNVLLGSTTGWANAGASGTYSHDAGVTITGNTTSGSAYITSVSSTANVSIGCSVVGTGIPVGSVVTSIPSSSTITLSQAATATASTVSLAISGNEINYLEILNCNFAGQISTGLAKYTAIENTSTSTLVYGAGAGYATNCKFGHSDSDHTANWGIQTTASLYGESPFEFYNTVIFGDGWMYRNGIAGKFTNCVLDASKMVTSLSTGLGVFGDASYGTLTVKNCVVISSQVSTDSPGIYSGFASNGANKLDSDYNFYVLNSSGAFANNYTDPLSTSNHSFAQMQIAGQDTHSTIIANIEALVLNSSYQQLTGSPLLGAGSNGTSIGLLLIPYNYNAGDYSNPGIADVKFGTTYKFAGDTLVGTLYCLPTPEPLPPTTPNSYICLVNGEKVGIKYTIINNAVVPAITVCKNAAATSYIIGTSHSGQEPQG